MSKNFKITLSILSLFTLITGTYSYKVTKISNTITPITYTEKEKVQHEDYISYIYFPNFNSATLTKEEVKISGKLETKEEVYYSIINDLILKLKSLNILEDKNFSFEIYNKNKDIYLDLDSRILLSAKEAQQEVLIIYSFVNSLLELGGNDRVILLVDGEKSDKINFVNISNFYQKNNSI